MSVVVGPVESRSDEELEDLSHKLKEPAHSPPQSESKRQLADKKVKKILGDLTTTEKGLRDEEVEERRKEFGYNALPKKKSAFFYFQRLILGR